MRLANHIKVSVFVKQEDDEAAVKKHLLALLPFGLEQEKIVLHRSRASGFNQKEIVILEVDLKKRGTPIVFLSFLKKILMSSRGLRLQSKRTDWMMSATSSSGWIRKNFWQANSG